MPQEIRFNDQPKNFLLSDRINDRIQPRDMILDDLWPARTIGLFTGDGGIGKTHFTFQLLKLIVTGDGMPGTPFRCSRPRPVVFISQEDEGDFLLDEIRTQFPELRTQREVTSRIRIISTAVEGPSLYLRERSSSSEENYLMDNIPEESVFVLDSWSTFLTCDESLNIELLRHGIAPLREIMKAKRATPLLIHHRPKPNSQTGKQASYRGGTALQNSCRFHMMVEKYGPSVKLSFEKVSRGVKPDDIYLQFNEERRILVPRALDRYVSLFQDGETHPTTEIMVRLGEDPNDDLARKRVLDALRQRSRRNGPLAKVGGGTRGVDATWRRNAQQPSESD